MEQTIYSLLKIDGILAVLVVAIGVSIGLLMLINRKNKQNNSA